MTTAIALMMTKKEYENKIKEVLTTKIKPELRDMHIAVVATQYSKYRGGYETARQMGKLDDLLAITTMVFASHDYNRYLEYQQKRIDYLLNHYSNQGAGNNIIDDDDDDE